MGKIKVEFLGIVAIFVVAVLLSGHLAVAEVRVDHRKDPHYDKICDGDLRKLSRFCRKSIVNNRKSAPAPTRTCCRTVGVVDLYCLCREITESLEKAISMEKVAHVAEVCQRPIRSGTKCGSYTVPTSPPPPSPPPPPPKIQEERRVVPPPPPSKIS